VAFPQSLSLYVHHVCVGWGGDQDLTWFVHINHKHQEDFGRYKRQPLKHVIQKNNKDYKWPPSESSEYKYNNSQLQPFVLQINMVIKTECK